MRIMWHSARNVGHAQEIVTAHAMSSSSVKLQWVPAVWDEGHISVPSGIRLLSPHVPSLPDNSRVLVTVTHVMATCP